MSTHTATAIMLCLATLTTSACVKRSTYDATVADLEATKAEFYSTKTQSQVLTEEVSELQQQRSDIARQMEATTSGFRQVTQEMEAGRASLQKRLSRLSRVISQLTAEQDNLLYALERENNKLLALQTLVEQHKSKLGQAGGPGTPVSTPPVKSTDQSVEPAPTQKPTATPPAAPVKPQSSEQGEENWLSMLKEWVLSLLRSIF